MISKRASGPSALSGLVHVAVVAARRDVRCGDEEIILGFMGVPTIKEGVLVREEDTNTRGLSRRPQHCSQAEAARQSDIPAQQVFWLYGVHRAEQ